MTSSSSLCLSITVESHNNGSLRTIKSFCRGRFLLLPINKRKKNHCKGLKNCFHHRQIYDIVCSKLKATYACFLPPWAVGIRWVSILQWIILPHHASWVCQCIHSLKFAISARIFSPSRPSNHRLGCFIYCHIHKSSRWRQNSIKNISLACISLRQTRKAMCAEPLAAVARLCDNMRVPNATQLDHSSTTQTLTRDLDSRLT